MKQIALLAWISPTEGMHINYEWLAIPHILAAVREMSEVGASAANPMAVRVTIQIRIKETLEPSHVELRSGC
jgi:hypothetical protein